MPVLGRTIGRDLGLATDPAEFGRVEEQIRRVRGTALRTAAARALAVQLLPGRRDQLVFDFTTQTASTRYLSCRLTRGSGLGPLSWRQVACGHFKLPRAAGTCCRTVGSPSVRRS